MHLQQQKENRITYPKTAEIVDNLESVFGPVKLKSTTEQPKEIEEMVINIKTYEDKMRAIEFISKLDLDGSIDVSFNDHKGKKRTGKQNSSLHVYIKQLSDALNNGGYDVRTTIKSEVSFTPDSIKKYFFKPVMKAMHPDKTSTTELSTTEVYEVYKHLDKMTAEKFSITLEWPSI